MKRFFGIALIVAIVLGSCNSFGSLLNPVIGTWQTEILGVTFISIYDADGTFTDTDSVGSVGGTENGTWVSNSGTIVKTYSNESNKAYSYSFNSNNTEMTFVPLPDGLSITHTRQ